MQYSFEQILNRASWNTILCVLQRVCAVCMRLCGKHTLGSFLVTLYHKHWTVIRFSTHLRLCVFMQLKGIGLYQTADYYLLHWVREDLIQLANSPFPPPRFKERIIFFFVPFPFAQPSWRIPGKQSCKSCNKNASVSIKQRRDKNRRLQKLCLGQSLVETDCRAGGIITLCVKNTLGANKVAAYLNENTQRLEYADESCRGSGGDVCLQLYCALLSVWYCSC